MFANHNPLENFVELAVFSVLINLAGYERKVLLILCPQMMHHDLSIQILMYSGIQNLSIFLCFASVRLSKRPLLVNILKMSIFTEHYLFESLMVGFTRVHSYTVYLGHGSRAIVLL